MTNTNTNASAPVQLTQLDWLGNLSSLLTAAEDCFVTGSASAYHESLRMWNTSNGSAGGADGSTDSGNNPYSERGPHKLPGVCSLTWRDGSWYMHLLPEDLLEVIEGLFADGRLNTVRVVGSDGSDDSNDSEDTEELIEDAGDPREREVYLKGDFTVRRYSDGDCELSYAPAMGGSIKMLTLVDQEELGNARAVLERCGIHI